MTIVRSLLLGAAASGCGLAAAATPVGAKPARARQEGQISALKAEVEALRAEVAALNARLTAQEGAKRAQREEVLAPRALTPVTGMQTQVAATAGAAEPTPGTAASTQPKPAAGWWEATTLSGRTFFNVSRIAQESDGQTVGRSTGFDVKRLYLSVEHRFSAVYSANITTDVSLIANTSNATGTANSGTPQPGQGTAVPSAFPRTVGETLFIKKAYFQAKYDPAFAIRIGAADLPWIPFAEDVYGYRWIEQEVVDRTGFGTSTDWGLHAFGALGGGHLNYALSVVGGAGYRNPLRSRSPDVEGRISATYNGFVAAVGGYAGKRAADTFTPFSPVNNAVTPAQTGTSVGTLHTAKRFDALLAYTDERLRVGGEYFYARNWNQVSRVPSDASEGWSGFASYRFERAFSVFGRYDRVRPSKALFPRIREHYFNFGLSYQPVELVDLALVYKRDQVNNGFFAPGNNSPAGFAFPIGGRDRGTTDELGLYGQFRF